MADDLFKATSSDAAAFERALRTPALRSELEQTLNRPLPDDTLKAMASHARSEADYWAAYRSGIERTIGAEYPGSEGRRAPGRQPPPTEVEPIVNPAATCRCRIVGASSTRSAATRTRSIPTTPIP
jgi:hypothetical protein